MRKVPLGMYLISSIICLLVFQIPFISIAAVDNFSVSKDVKVAVQEIKDDVSEIDRGGLNTFFSEITKSFTTLFKPVIKIVIQIAIFFFKLVVSFLEYLKNLF